jgi:Fe-S-cluster containining protein
MSTQDNKSKAKIWMEVNELVPEAFKLADRIVHAGLERVAKLGSKVPCVKSCAICCHYMIRVSIPEAFYLYERLLECKRPWRDKIFERFRLIRETLMQNGLDKALERDLVRESGDVSYDYRLHLLSQRYFSLRLACPFLEDKVCSIYSWRPVTCRQYYVTSPASRCVDPFAKNVNRVSLPFNVADLLAQATADISGEPFRMIAFPFAMKWADKNKERAKLRWPAEICTRISEKTIGVN